MSGLGSHPAASAYHCRHCDWEGRPGAAVFREEGTKAERFVAPTNLVRAVGEEANVYGDKRFERSERGWPIVDISQLWGKNVSEISTP